jgi:hypothetical protein
VEECLPLVLGNPPDSAPAIAGRVETSVRGEAVQVDSIKIRVESASASPFEASSHDEPLSKFAFNFILRRYNEATVRDGQQGWEFLWDTLIDQQAGAYTRSLQSSTWGPSGHLIHVRA